MKKDSVLLRVVAMMLIATGVSLSATSSQAGDLTSEMKNRNCGYYQLTGDKVHGVHLSDVSGNVMKFVVDVSVDPRHLAGTDGIKRLKTIKGPDGYYWEPMSLEGVEVAVKPYDRHGKPLWSSYALSKAPLSGSKKVYTTATLPAGVNITQAANVLVEVYETGHGNGFKFCRVLNLKYDDDFTSPLIRPKLVSSKKCLNIGNKTGGSPTCIGERSTFDQRDPIWILVKIRNVTPGNHALFARYYNSKDFYRQRYPGQTFPFYKKSADYGTISRCFKAKYNYPAGIWKVVILLDGDELGNVYYNVKGQPTPPAWVKKETIYLSAVETAIGEAYWMGLRQKKGEDEVNGIVVRVENKGGTMRVYHLNDEAFGSNGIQLKHGVNEIKIKAIDLLNHWKAVPEGSEKSVTLVIHYLKD